MLIIGYVFVVLAACEVTGRMEKGQPKLPGLKEIFNDDSWQKTFSTFDPIPNAFSGPMSGLTTPLTRIPTLYALFHKFWTPQTLRKICVETNRYASEINPLSKCNPQKLRGGE